MSDPVVLRDWRPEFRASREEVKLMVSGIVEELRASLKAEPRFGERLFYVGGDTLVIGNIDPDGNLVVYECAIRASNTEEDQVPEGEVVVQTKEPMLS